MDFLPLAAFRACVARYQGEYKVRGFSCLDQFLCLAFAQLTYRESLRDIETCLRAMQPKLYHMGIRGRVARSTLADANETRDWRIYADFAQLLIAIAKPLYATEPFGVDLAATVYAFDSTTIDLCLGLSQSLYTILQVLSVTLFENAPINQALALLSDTTSDGEGCNRSLPPIDSA